MVAIPFETFSVTGLGARIPAGSNHSSDLNMERTVAYCSRVISSPRLLGFMTAPWRPVLPPCLDQHRQAIQQIAQAMNRTE